MIVLNNRLRALSLVPSGYGLMRVYSDTLKIEQEVPSKWNLILKTLVKFSMYDYAPLTPLLVYYIFTFGLIRTIVFFIFGYLLMNSIYELGYLMNDTVSGLVEGREHKVRVKLNTADIMIILLSRLTYAIIFTVLIEYLTGHQHFRFVVLAEVLLSIIFLTYNLTPKHVRTVMFSFPLKLMKMIVLLVPFILTGSPIDNAITLSFILPIAVRFAQAHYLKTACDDDILSFNKRTGRFYLMYLQVLSLSASWISIEYLMMGNIQILYDYIIPSVTAIMLIIFSWYISGRGLT